MKREFRDYDDDFNEADEGADDMNLIREGDEQQNLRTIQFYLFTQFERIKSPQSPSFLQNMLHRIDKNKVHV